MTEQDIKSKELDFVSNYVLKHYDPSSDSSDELQEIINDALGVFEEIWLGCFPGVLLSKNKETAASTNLWDYNDK